jgi:outer membrane protein assembly factor BamB
VGFYDAFYSLNSLNGFVNWKSQSSLAGFVSPAIGDDGTVYAGAYDQQKFFDYVSRSPGSYYWLHELGSLPKL